MRLYFNFITNSLIYYDWRSKKTVKWPEGILCNLYIISMFSVPYMRKNCLGHYFSPTHRYQIIEGIETTSIKIWNMFNFNQLHMFPFFLHLLYFQFSVLHVFCKLYCVLKVFYVVCTKVLTIWYCKFGTVLWYSCNKTFLFLNCEIYFVNS